MGLAEKHCDGTLPSPEIAVAGAGGVSQAVAGDAAEAQAYIRSVAHVVALVLAVYAHLKGGS